MAAMIERGGQGYMKKITLLSEKKGRDIAGQFTVEGEKLVNEMPEDWTVEFYAASDSYLSRASCAGLEKRAPIVAFEDRLFKKISDTASPQGIMAVCRKRNHSLSSMILDGCLLIMCESLSDPGNVGTLARAAEAAHAGGIILTKGSADIFSPKTIRASAGSIFRIPFAVEVDALEAAAELKERGVFLCAARIQGGMLPYSIDFRNSFCIVIGNEAHGLSERLAECCDVAVKLPMDENVDSLNAAVAGSILLFEAVRQRIIGN
jgi:TrmH family RNA methyltransferase